MISSLLNSDDRIDLTLANYYERSTVAAQFDYFEERGDTSFHAQVATQRQL